MAFDKAGKYHMNPARAKMADSAPPKQGNAKQPHDMTKPGPEGETADGSDVPKLLEELHAKHGGKHMHVHHDGITMTSHHIGDDGVVEGPHEHATTDDLKSHMDMAFGGEETPQEEAMEQHEHSLSGY